LLNYESFARKSSQKLSRLLHNITIPHSSEASRSHACNHSIL